MTPSGQVGLVQTVAATAILWDGADLPLRTVQVRDVLLAPGDALLMVELATICGSDLHTITGRRPGPAPSVLGHETIGQITAFGPGPAPQDVLGRTLTVGDRVAVGIYAACGRCRRCLSGLEQKCESLFKYGHVTSGGNDILTGGFASHLHLRQGTPLVRVGDLPAAVAAPLGCATATAVACVTAAVTNIGDPLDLGVPSAALQGVEVTVTGAGLVGLLATALLADQGATVTTIDPHPDRRDRSLRFGARTSAPPGQEIGIADLFLELSGSPTAVAGAIEATTIGGTIVLAGTVSPGVPLPWEAQDMVRKLITLRGVHNYRPTDLVTAARWSAGALHRLPLHEMQGPTFPLSELESAITLATGSAALRVGIRPS